MYFVKIMARFETIQFDAKTKGRVYYIVGYWADGNRFRYFVNFPAMRKTATGYVDVTNVAETKCKNFCATLNEAMTNKQYFDKKHWVQIDPDYATPAWNRLFKVAILFEAPTVVTAPPAETATVVDPQPAQPAIPEVIPEPVVEPKKKGKGKKTVKAA